MRTDEPPRLPARYLAVLVRHLQAQGLDCAAPLRELGIDPGWLRAADAQLPADRLVAATRALARLSGRTDLGLVMGGGLRMGQLGDVGRAMLACDTVLDALQCCARHHAHVSPTLRLSCRLNGEQLELAWHLAQPVPYDLLVLVFDIALAAFHGQISRVLREVPAYDAFMPWPAPAHAAAYRALRPLRCHFGTGGLPVLRVCLDAAALRVPMPLADPAEREAVEQRLALHPHASAAPPSWKRWVVQLLEQSHARQPTQDEVAALAGVSTSTLARRLADEGCSFRALAGEVRHRRACAWLTAGSLPVAEVAQRLGYTHPANFIRAFRAQAGVSPARYARQHGALR